MWVSGRFECPGFRMLAYTFEAKVFGQGSEFGLGNGPISKLFIYMDGRIMFSWDRGPGIGSDQHGNPNNISHCHLYGIMAQVMTQAQKMPLVQSKELMA